tara:strand:+ start:320 stop:1387 length:1068 start_codon:yes stop_codon:yes gene_type:complete
MKIKLSDPKIFVVTIAWLIILVFIGTVDQKYIGLYAAQNKYFSSLIFWLWYIPLPGGMLAMFILTCNLIAFLLQKNIWNTKKMGVIIIHLGSILLLVGGGITYFFSFEGAMPITTRNKISNFMYSYHDKELVIINENEYQDSLEFTKFNEKILFSGNQFTYPTIPFDITILKYCVNANRIGNNDIECIASEIEDAENNSAIKLLIEAKNIEYQNINGEYISALGYKNPRIKINNIYYNIVLQPKKTYLPFSIELINVTEVLHPNSAIAQSYSSEVNIIDNGQSRRKLIEMNIPLRYKGYTFYQAHYEQDQNTGVKTSVLAVVKNYGRLFPYISSIIMCIGVLLQIFIRIPRLLKK